MIAYIVMVRPGSPDRYTDSIWVLRENADRRANALAEEFIRRGRPTMVGQEIGDWRIWVSPVEIEDAKMGKNDAHPSKA